MFFINIISNIKRCCYATPITTLSALECNMFCNNAIESISLLSTSFLYDRESRGHLSQHVHFSWRYVYSFINFGANYLTFKIGVVKVIALRLGQISGRVYPARFSLNMFFKYSKVRKKKLKLEILLFWSTLQIYYYTKTQLFQY